MPLLRRDLLKNLEPLGLWGSPCRANNKRRSRLPAPRAAMPAPKIKDIK